jgi:protein SCO1/2
VTRRDFHALLLPSSLGLLATACAHRETEIPKYDTVPPFRMTDANNRPFTEKDLNGKVWIVDFIYTNCPAECPRMTSKMHQLEKRTAGEPHLRFLSISVDPHRDTPEVLKEFAGRYGGLNERWRFLTGDEASVHLLAYKTFHVGDVIGRIEHSTKFALLDKHRVVRGYYSSFSEDDMAQMLTDVHVLGKENS